MRQHFRVHQHRKLSESFKMKSRKLKLIKRIGMNNLSPSLEKLKSQMLSQLPENKVLENSFLKLKMTKTNLRLTSWQKWSKSRRPMRDNQKSSSKKLPKLMIKGKIFRDSRPLLNQSLTSKKLCQIRKQNSWKKLLRIATSVKKRFLLSLKIQRKIS